MGLRIVFAVSFFAVLCAGGFARAGETSAQILDMVSGCDPQPAVAMAARVEEALGMLGSVLRAEDAAKLDTIRKAPPDAAAVEALQRVLDPYCLAEVDINPESRVKVLRGPAPAALVQGGWRVYLIKVRNEGAVRTPLQVLSPNAQPALHRSSGGATPLVTNAISPGEEAQRYLELAFYHGRPMEVPLSGLPLEYKILQVYSKDAGQREARIGFHLGPGTEDLAMRNAIDVLFACSPAIPVTFRVRDDDGKPTTAGFVIRDNVNRFPRPESGDDPSAQYQRTQAQKDPFFFGLTNESPFVGLYPLPSRRVADSDPYPDFFFQPQVYRMDGEEVLLPPGQYDVTWTRGPEYLQQSRTITVSANDKPHEEVFALKRWIDMGGMGYFSSDHHVHAGGCSHYESPAAGVKPEAMMRQALGEDLNVSEVLTWGPCWYHQKEYFEGKVHALSQPNYVMRYDVEVSGFPSSHAGHVCLLRLVEDDYPGTKRIEEWPTFTLPVLKWGKRQGGLVGYAHSGHGLAPLTPTLDLPNFAMPAYDGIGANEYIVTVAHGACDFISSGDTASVWELNIWYHTLNCGYRAVISGETDYPCIYDERVGMARSYVKMPKKWNYDAFIDRLGQGRAYTSDGRAHVVDFKARAGRKSAVLEEKEHEIAVKAGDTVKFSARVAAFLPEQQTARGREIAAGGVLGKPAWHLEKARIGDSREVYVDLVVNGYAADRKRITADGKWHEVEFECPVQYSSWAALRIAPSLHTNPLYLIADGKPIRASRRSAQWCRDGVDQCWSMKAPAIRDSEKEAARAAYDLARNAYDKIITEAVDDIGKPMPAATALGGQRPLDIPQGATAVLPKDAAALRTAGWMPWAYTPTTFTDIAYWARGGDGSERFRWTLDGLAPGMYRLSAWVPENSRRDRAPDATFRVVHANGQTPVAIDQTAGTKGWRPLGEFQIGPGSYIELTNKARGNVVADAVLAEPTTATPR